MGVGQIPKKNSSTDFKGKKNILQMNSGEKKKIHAELPKTITKKYLFHVIRPKRSQSEDYSLYMLN